MCDGTPLVLHFVSALAGEGPSPRDPGKVYIIVPQSRAYLADLLAKAVQGREDMVVIVDRRRRERRTREESVMVDRRHGARRKPKDDVIEVVLASGTRREQPSEGPA